MNIVGFVVLGTVSKNNTGAYQGKVTKVKKALLERELI